MNGYIHLRKPLWFVPYSWGNHFTNGSIQLRISLWIASCIKETSHEWFHTIEVTILCMSSRKVNETIHEWFHTISLIIPCSYHFWNDSRVHLRKYFYIWFQKWFQFYGFMLLKKPPGENPHVMPGFNVRNGFTALLPRRKIFQNDCMVLCNGGNHFMNGSMHMRKPFKRWTMRAEKPSACQMGLNWW